MCSAHAGRARSGDCKRNFHDCWRPNSADWLKPRLGVCTCDPQVCGARGGGDGAAQGLFLAFNRGQAFMLVGRKHRTGTAYMLRLMSCILSAAAPTQACESSKQRNVCILLIRKLAAARGYALKGPITE